MPQIDEKIKALFVTDDGYWNLLQASKDIGAEYELDLAKSDSEALGKIREEDYDAMVSDASVKELDSILLLKEIRSKGVKIPFILLTGKGDEETAVEALENGANFYMPKTGDPHLHFAELASMIYQSVLRARMEVQLRESRADLLAIFENSPTMITLVNEELDVIMVNSAMARFIGDDTPTIVGRRMGEAVHCLHSYEEPEGCGYGLLCKTCTIRKALESTFETEVGIKNAEVEQDELRGTTKCRFNLRVTTAPLVILGKRMVAVYIEDITEQKRMQTAILMANKKLNLLGTVTRHDTVNQLSVLMGNLEIASMKDPRSPVIKYLRKAIESGENIATILSFSKDYQLMGTQAPSMFNVRESCMRGIATVDTKEVKVHIETGDLQIFADRMLEKVFLNLMDNSIRHGETVKNIWVHSRPAENGVCVIFEDDGVGVPSSEKEKIFDLGYGKHTGLGLYLVREILSITGISIVESGSEGKGAQFTLLVPNGSFIET
jgi:DNA-binding NarL/FixJ family response regulator/nitrogen-specific signal transduction histidine kinase